MQDMPLHKAWSAGAAQVTSTNMSHVGQVKTLQMNEVTIVACRLSVFLCLKDAFNGKATGERGSKLLFRSRHHTQGLWELACLSIVYTLPLCVPLIFTFSFFL